MKELTLITDERIKSALRNSGMPEDVIEGTGIYRYFRVAEAQLAHSQRELEAIIEQERQAIGE